MTWWSEEICLAHQAACAACSRLEGRPGNVYLRVEYQMAREHTRRLMIKARKDLGAAYENVFTLTARNPMSQIWKRARKIAGKFSLPAALVIRINHAPVAPPYDC